MKKKAAVIDKARIDAELLALQAARCQNSLKAFATAVWPLIEPVPFVDGWVVDAVCDHLEALTRGDIKKIVINIPPRHSKPLYTASMLLMADGSRKPLSVVRVGV